MTTGRKILNVFMWILTNGIMGVITVLGVVYHMHWALNIARFLAWVGVFVLGMCSVGKHVSPDFKVPEKYVPLTMDIIYDLGIACVFVGGGHIFYGTLVLLQIFLYVDLFHISTPSTQAVL